MNATHIESYVDIILIPLQRVYSSIDIYMHTYNTHRFTNPRKGEYDVALDVSLSLEKVIHKVRQTKLFNRRVSFKEIKISEVQEADKSFRDLRHYLHRGDPWENQGMSMRYFLRQLYSLEQVTQLWEGRHRSLGFCNMDERDQICRFMSKKVQNSYDLVIYTRPDLFFWDRLPQINACESKKHDLGSCSHENWGPQRNTIYTASFDDYNGLNDRFALGTPFVMRHYGHRVQMIEDYFERYPDLKLWAEPFLYKVMVEIFGINHAPLDGFRFTRVRADGFLGAT
jgi:hypothetical protein